MLETTDVRGAIVYATYMLPEHLCFHPSVSCPKLLHHAFLFCIVVFEIYIYIYMYELALPVLRLKSPFDHMVVRRRDVRRSIYVAERWWTKRKHVIGKSFNQHQWVENKFLVRSVSESSSVLGVDSFL
jgi:hypothetical protein